MRRTPRTNCPTVLSAAGRSFGPIHDQPDHDNHHEFHPGDAHHDKARPSRGILWPWQDSNGGCKQSGIRFCSGIPQAGTIPDVRLDNMSYAGERQKPSKCHRQRAHRRWE
jgi:hypothetical protein